jgi:hypothetical protein
MKTTTCALVIFLGSAACAQSPQGPQATSATVQSSAVANPAPEPTSSNPRASLPNMSADRCTAEAIGTAADPKTGAPVGAAVDPQTGKPLCPTAQPETDPPKPR